MPDTEQKQLKHAVLGADPGKHGAVVIFETSSFVPGKTCKMHSIQSKVKDGKLDTMALYDAVTETCKKHKLKLAYCIMESVHALFGSSASGTFEFGDANGSLRTALEFVAREHGCPLDITPPKAWQSVAWKCVPLVTHQKKDSSGKLKFLKSGEPWMETETKATSMNAAAAIFPAVNFIPANSRKVHDGIIDAALMAYVAWCRASKYNLC